MRSWKAENFAFWVLVLAALPALVGATVTFNTTAGTFSPGDFYNSTNITGQAFTFGVTNQTQTLIVYNVSVLSNFSGTWIENTTNTSSFTSVFQTAAATNKNITINVTGMAQGLFVWTIQVWANDSNTLTRAIMSSNFTLIVDTTAPNVTTVNSPANSLFSSSQNITFNVTVKDNILIANASIFHNATGIWHRNTTNSSLTSIHNNTPILVTVANIPDGNVTSWIMEACDVAGNCAQYNANRTFTVDLLNDAVIAFNGTGTVVDGPRIRFFNSTGNGTWGGQIELPTAGSPTRFFKVKYSPVSNKIVLVTQSTDNKLDLYTCVQGCRSASSWVVTNDIGTVGGSTERRFDLEFESLTGNAIILYAVLNSTTTCDLAYKVLVNTNSSLSGANEQCLDDTGHATDLAYTHVRLDRNPRANSTELTAIATDGSSSDANAWVWNGSAWTNQFEVSSTVSLSSLYDPIAVRYAADASNATVLAGNSSGWLNYSTWNGSDWKPVKSFDPETTSTGVPRFLSLKADPATDDLQLVSAVSTRLSTSYWNGASWTATSVDLFLSASTTRAADFEWLNTSSLGRLVWGNDVSETNQRPCSPQCTGTTAVLSTYNGLGQWISLYRNPRAASEDVDFVGIRLNDSNAIGSFQYNNSGTDVGSYRNNGDTNITGDAGGTAYEVYSVDFRLVDGVDSQAPNVTALNSPANDFSSGSTTINFNVTVTDNRSIANASVFHNASGVWQRTATTTSPLNNTPFVITVTDIAQNTSVWNVEACDATGNCTFYNANRTLIVDLTAPNVTTVNSPVNQLNSSTQTITFNVTVKDDVQLANASIFHNATGIWHRNATNSSIGAANNNTPILVTVSNLPEINRSVWIMEACDTAGNCAQYNANRTFIVDLTQPRVQVINFSKTSDTSAFLNVSISDANAINTTIVSFASVSATTNYTNTLTRFPADASNTSGYYNMSFTSLGYDTYTIYVYVNDSAGNPNSTASQSITIGSSGGSSGGSGGGGSVSSSSSPATPTPAPSVSKIPSPIPSIGPPASPVPFSPPSASPTPSPQATPAPTPNSALVAVASGAISSASNSLADARGKGVKGVDVSAAENLLALARQAQAAGKFVQAQQYAQEAQKLLESSAKSAASPPTAVAGFTTPVMPYNLIIGVVVLALLGAGAYVLTQRGAAPKKK